MKKIIAAFMTTAILLTAFAGCGKEKAAETSTTAQTSENTTNEVTKVTSGNALSIPTDELSENVEFYPVDVDGTEMDVIAVKDSTGTYAQHSTPARYAMIPAKDTINRKAISWSARTVEIPLPWIR